jgi:serine/threonine protein kinase
MSTGVTVNVGEGIRSRSDTFYRVLQPLGSGGNSDVYLALATNKQTKGVVFALKVFARLAKTERLDRFFRETEFLRNHCSHPSIMKVYDEGTLSHRLSDENVQYPFVVAEYLPETLATFVYRPSDMAERVSCGLQLLSALCYLDSRPDKVIHRDIKPQNIFVKGKSFVLGDFGLMKFADDESTADAEYLKVSSSHGMPFYYRSPDLVDYLKGSKSLSTKSDVFQLGLVLAQVFTGKNPEKPAKNLTDVVELRDVGQIPGSHGAQIRDVILSMLEPDPNKRPSASEIIDVWEGMFRDIARLSYDLNGRVF